MTVTQIIFDNGHAVILAIVPVIMTICTLALMTSIGCMLIASKFKQRKRRKVKPKTVADDAVLL